jgi:hypothetical protein
VRFPRLPWGPRVPPMSGPPTEESATFLLRSCIGIALIGFIIGLIYATGIGQNHRTAGFILIALSVGCLYPCWVMARIRHRLRATNGAAGQKER